MKLSTLLTGQAIGALAVAQIGAAIVQKDGDAMIKARELHDKAFAGLENLYARDTVTVTIDGCSAPPAYSASLPPSTASVVPITSTIESTPTSIPATIIATSAPSSKASSTIPATGTETIPTVLSTIPSTESVGTTIPITTAASTSGSVFGPPTGSETTIPAASSNPLVPNASPDVLNAANNVKFLMMVMSAALILY